MQTVLRESEKRMRALDKLATMTRNPFEAEALRVSADSERAYQTILALMATHNTGGL